MLAAQASAAVPGLTLVSTTDISDEHRHAALATDVDSRAWVVELPQTDDEELGTRERIGALGAIGDGLRSRLPFGVPRIHGETNVRGRTLTVGEWLPGFRPDPKKIAPGGCRLCGASDGHPARHSGERPVRTGPSHPLRERIAADCGGRR